MCLLLQVIPFLIDGNALVISYRVKTRTLQPPGLGIP